MVDGCCWAEMPVRPALRAQREQRERRACRCATDPLRAPSHRGEPIPHSASSGPDVVCAPHMTAIKRHASATSHEHATSDSTHRPPGVGSVPPTGSAFCFRFTTFTGSEGRTYESHPADPGRCIVLLFPGLDAWAQTTAQINGTVVDEGGGVLPGVTVAALQTDTGFRREAVTDVAGSYTLTNLPIGPYRLEVDARRLPHLRADRDRPAGQQQSRDSA